MRLMDRYLLRQVWVAGFVTVVIVTIVVWLTQVLRLLDLVLDRGAPMGTLVQLLILTIPTFLGLIIPLALTAAVIFVYYRLLLESELVVLRAAGVSNWKLARPILQLAAGMVLLCYFIAFVAAPFAQRELSRIELIIKNDYAVALLRDGMFNKLSDGITVYVRDRSGTDELRGILIHDSSDKDKTATLFAEKGILQQDEQGGRVVLLNGMRQEKTLATGAVSELKFEQYAIDLSQFATDDEPGWIDPKERTVTQLIDGDVNDDKQPLARGRLLAELTQRLTGPLVSFVFPLLAIGLLLTAEVNRRGMTGRIVAAAASVTLWQIALIMCTSLVPKNMALVWLPYALVLAPLPVLLFWLAPARLRVKAGGEAVQP